jgi:hypothetical protein
MKKYESMSVRDFLNTDFTSDQKSFNRLKTHIKNNKTIYQVAGLTITVFLVGENISFAAESGIDRGMKKLFYKIVDLGKWIIIIKGAIEIIRSIGDGDLKSGQKVFLTYLLMYLLLLGLPWGFDQVDQLFLEISGT